MRSVLRTILSENGLAPIETMGANVRPGVVLRSGEIFEDLSQVPGLWESTPSVTSPRPMRLQRNEVIRTSSGSAAFGLAFGLPSSARLDAIAQASRRVEVKIDKLSVSYLKTDDGIEYPADWIRRINDHLDLPEIQEILRVMKQRLAAVRVPRGIDIVAATVYAEVFSLVAEHDTRGNVQAEIDAVQADASVTIEAASSGRSSVIWTPSQAVPIAFRPVRYGWSPGKRIFLSQLG